MEPKKCNIFLCVCVCVGVFLKNFHMFFRDGVLKKERKMNKNKQKRVHAVYLPSIERERMKNFMLKKQ